MILVILIETLQKVLDKEGPLSTRSKRSDDLSKVGPTLRKVRTAIRMLRALAAVAEGMEDSKKDGF